MKGHDRKLTWLAFMGLNLGLVGSVAGAQTETLLQPMLKPMVILQPILQPNLQPNLLAAKSLLIVPEDGAVTLIWDWPAKADIAGYDVYLGREKINVQPISSEKSPEKSKDTLSYRVKGLKNGEKYEFSVLPIPNKISTAKMQALMGVGTPLVCDRYSVQGSDMGAQFQNIRVGRGPANVMVNGTTIPASSGIYQGQLPAAVPVGGPLNLLTSVGSCLVYATDRVPERPNLTTPTNGFSLNVANTLPVTWTSSSNPDRFVVSASWLINSSSGTGWRSGDIAGTERTFSIPAGTLPADKAVKIRVYAYNDGTETFIGSYTADSRMAIRNGDEAGRDIITVATLAPSNPPAVSWGDPHLLTFDQTAVEFQSVGEFDLTQSLSGSEFRVQARQLPWGGSGTVSVNSAVATRLNGQKVGLYTTSSPPLRIGDVGTPTTVPAGGLDFGGGYRVSQSGNDFIFDYPSGERMTLTNNGGYIDARVSLPNSRRGQVRGLWGNFDGVTTNDLFLRSGAALSSPASFADFYGLYAHSWRVPNPAESLFVYGGGERFGGFDNPAFPSATPVVSAVARAAAEATCRAAGITDPILLNACITDVATTGQPRFASGTAATQRPQDQVSILMPSTQPDLIVPDLIVTGATVNFSGICRPNQALVLARVTVRNIGGTATPALPSVGVVQVVDSRDETLGAGYRGNGVGLGSLAAGASATVDIPIYFPVNTPNDAAGPHSYIARVNFGHYFAEASTANNRFGTPLNVTIPSAACLP